MSTCTTILKRFTTTTMTIYDDFHSFATSHTRVSRAFWADPAFSKCLRYSVSRSSLDLAIIFLKLPRSMIHTDESSAAWRESAASPMLQLFHFSHDGITMSIKYYKDF